MAIEWTTLAASAGVAAAVSVVAEVTVKPWLEARKDRTVRRHRDRDEAIASLRQLDARLLVLRHWARSSIKTDDELLSELRALEELAGQFFSRINHFPFSLPVAGVFAVATASLQVNLAGLQESYRRGRSRKSGKFLPRDFGDTVYRDVLDSQLLLSIPSLYLETKPWELRRRCWLNRESVHALESADDTAEALREFGRKYASPDLRRELDPSIPRVRLADVQRRF